MKKPVIDKFRGNYGFLSNFHPSALCYKGNTYPTAEHLFQALKTTSRRGRRKISLAATPTLAKRMGRRVPLRKNWEDIKLEMMEGIIHLKFLDPELKRSLFNTGDVKLMEGNYWHDNFWGNCYCHKCRKINGQNHLGKILMKVRDKNTWTV